MDIDFDIPTIIEGYRQGYFLMADGEDNQLNWYSSNERTLIPLDERFRFPKSLRRVLNQNRFSVAINKNFQAVCDGCANRETTWISPELQHMYVALHQAGWVHSFETWQGDQLAGGILGFSIGGAFIGESMFFNIPEASKVAMVKLVEHLRNKQYLLFDAQLQNPHLERFGSYLIGSDQYQIMLEESLRLNCEFNS